MEQALQEGKVDGVFEQLLVGPLAGGAMRERP